MIIGRENKLTEIQKKYSWLFVDKSEYFYYILNIDNPSKPFIVSRLNFNHKYFANKVLNKLILKNNRSIYVVVDGKFAKNYPKKLDKNLNQKKVDIIYTRNQMIRLMTFVIERKRNEKYLQFFSDSFEEGTYKEYFSNRTGKRKRKNGSVEKSRTLARKLKRIYVYYFMDVAYGMSSKELRMILGTA